MSDDLIDDDELIPDGTEFVFSAKIKNSNVSISELAEGFVAFQNDEAEVMAFVFEDFINRYGGPLEYLEGNDIVGDLSDEERKEFLEFRQKIVKLHSWLTLNYPEAL